MMSPFDQLLVLSILLSGLLCSLGNTFIDSHDFQHDNHTLQQGSNLLYFTLGSKKHNLEVARHIVTFYKSNTWGCYDVHHHSSISDYVHGANGNEDVKFVIVHGLECLSASERRSLDFAYRLTDSSIDVSHVVILFVMETIEHALPVIMKVEADSTPGQNTKLKLAESLNEESTFFNGHAFTGRLARTFFESNFANIEIPAPSCAAAVQARSTQDNICAQLSSATQAAHFDQSVALKANRDHSSFSMALFTTLAVVVLLVILSIVRYCTRSREEEGNNNTNPTYKPNSVSATVYGASSNSHGSNNLYSSHVNSSPAVYTSPTYDMYAESFANQHNTTETSPSQRTTGVTRRSLTRLQAKQLATQSAASSPTHTTTTATDNTTIDDITSDTKGSRTHTTTTSTHTKDRRSTGSSTTTRRTTHKNTTTTSNSPSGEESIMWVGQDSEAHDTRTKKHTRASARF